MVSNKFRLGVVLMVALVSLTACGGPAAAPAPTATTAPAEPTVAPAAEPAATTAPVEKATASTGEIHTFAIDPARSTVRFTLTEELMGAPTTVVGESRAVEGSVEVDLANHAGTVIAPIRVDATTFVTDNNFRNRAIRRFILQSEQPEYQFITFTPTGVEGLPAAAAVGEAFELTVTGDLTIRDITQPVSFVVSVTLTSETELQGNARATVLRGDFGLQIPDVPSVANVSEEVQLEMDFVAVAQ